MAAAIPEPRQTIQSLIDAHHEASKSPPRPHIGASQLGHHCDRWLWLSFRWAVAPRFSGRTLRIFRRGQNEEAIIVSDLRAIGMDVRTGSARQYHVDFGCHVSGSIDAIIESGVPEAPRKRHVAEFKTHSAKSFSELVKDGVQKSKPQHYAQCQLYMHGTGIDRALYVAICKDDDRIHTERLRYDKEYAERLVARGHRLALSDRIPEPCAGSSADWYLCKFCDAHSFCHGGEHTQEVNCRTCAHSTAKEDSTWRCERHGADGIPEEFQRNGCEAHALHPDLVHWQRADGLDQWTAVYIIDGVPVANGEPDAHVFGSREIIANPSACARNDDTLQVLRLEFDARVTT